MNDLAFDQGSDNLPGLVDVIYAVAQNDVDLTTTPLVLAVAGQLTLSANIVLKAGKKFGSIYITDESGDVNFKGVGPRDGDSLEVILSGKYPKVDTALFNWLRDIKGPLVVIYRMANTGKKFVMGFNNLDKTSTALIAYPPVYFQDLAGKAGKKRSDDNGADFNFKWNTIHGPIEYTGTIDVT